MFLLGFLWVLQYPPLVQRYEFQSDWHLQDVRSVFERKRLCLVTVLGVPHSVPQVLLDRPLAPQKVVQKMDG